MEKYIQELEGKKLLCLQWTYSKCKLVLDGKNTKAFIIFSFQTLDIFRILTGMRSTRKRKDGSLKW